jgi:dihydroflavonol-4-reductase
VGAATFGDVRDVASAVIAAAERGQSGRRYILGGYTFSYREAWQRMARSGGKLGPYLPMGPLFRGIVSPILDVYNGLVRREGDFNSAAIAMGRQEHCFSSRRAEEELGFRVRRFEESLADAWSWFREYGYV